VTTTAPPGRLYRWSAKSTNPAADLAHLQQLYEHVTGRAALWLRCHPDQEQLFAALWPDGVVRDSRVQRGTIMLGDAV
jgi:hypothetical protein